MTSNEEKKRERVKTVTPMEIKEPAGVKEMVEQNSIDQITIGWQNATEVAAEVWRQGNMALLDYFDWVSIPGTHEARKVYNKLYGYSLVTSGYSAMIPKVGPEYLEEIYKDLVAFKVNKQILTIFRNIIDNETSGN